MNPQPRGARGLTVPGEYANNLQNVSRVRSERIDVPCAGTRGKTSRQTDPAARGESAAGAPGGGRCAMSVSYAAVRSLAMRRMLAQSYCASQGGGNKWDITKI